MCAGDVEKTHSITAEGKDGRSGHKSEFSRNTVCRKARRLLNLSFSHKQIIQ